MKQAVKKAVEVILTIIAIISLILMCAERPDGSIGIWWNLGWLASLAISAKILDKMGAFKKNNN